MFESCDSILQESNPGPQSNLRKNVDTEKIFGVQLEDFKKEYFVYQCYDSKSYYVVTYQSDSDRLEEVKKLKPDCPEWKLEKELLARPKISKVLDQSLAKKLGLKVGQLVAPANAEVEVETKADFDYYLQHLHKNTIDLKISLHNSKLDGTLFNVEEESKTKLIKTIPNVKIFTSK